MTIIKRGLCACPQCGTEAESYSTWSFSTFSTGRRRAEHEARWSDGFGAQSYYAVYDDLRLCDECGTVYREHEAPWREQPERREEPRFLGRQTPSLPRSEIGSDKLGSRSERMAELSRRSKLDRPTPPSSEQEISSPRSGSLFKRMAELSRQTHNASEEAVQSDFLPRPSEEQDTSPRELMDSMARMNGRVPDSDAQETLYHGSFRKSSESLLRLKWWWHENAHQHENAPLAQEAIDHEQPEPPPLSGEMIENLGLLVPLLDPVRNRILLGEISRHLGRFEEAAGYFAPLASRPTPKRALIAPSRTVVPAAWTEQLAELAKLRRRLIVLLPEPQVVARPIMYSS